MMRNWKKMLAGAAAVCMCLSMAGCGEKDTFTEENLNSAIAALEKNEQDSDHSSETEAVEEIDPFENLKVTFSGIAPQSRIEYNGGCSYVTYTPNMETGMKNGDTVTITAELKSSYAHKYKLTETEKAYTAEGLAAYACTLDEIPDETKTKMQQQADDMITASCASWADGNSLKQSDFLGYYFLSPKNDFYTSPMNEIYLVYKNTADITGTLEEDDNQTVECGEEVYYTFVKFPDIVILDDGVCNADLSKGSMATATTKTLHGYWSWGYFERYKFYGYADLDSMFNDCITQNIDKYNYESTVQ